MKFLLMMLIWVFKYKAALVEKTADAVNNTNSSVKNAEIFVPLKYLSNFCKSLEMPLIDCKSNWIKLDWRQHFI